MCSDPRGRRRPLAGALALVWSLAALSGLACGKKGDPAPPLRAVPAPVRDLAVVQRGPRLLFTATHPKTTVAGQALSGLARVELWEVIRPLASAPRVPAPAPARPAPAAPGQPAAPDKPPAAAPDPPPAAAPDPPPAAAPDPPPAAAPDPPPAAAPDPSPAAAPDPPPPAGDAPAQPSPAPEPPAGVPAPEPAVPSAEASPAAEVSAEPATPAAPAAPATPPAAAVAPAGERPLAPLEPRELNAASKRVLVLEGGDIANATAGDRLLFDLPLPDPMPAEEARYYVVRTVGPTGEESGFSNQVVIAPINAPAPPATTAVNAQADGVLVEWAPPAGAAPSGYHVYRRSAQTRVYGAPIHLAGPADTRFLDTGARFGESYIYAVTAVARRAPTIESAIQSEHEVRFQDRFPPPPPRDLVALPGGGRVRLVWRSSEGDAAGYLVYRREAGEFRRLTESPIQELEWSDRNITPGVPYIYRVTAVDAAGNESEPAQVRAVAE